VMGAGVFIMAEVTGIPYTDLMVAAVLPALLYFVAVFFMVDNEAQRLHMKGLTAEELPKFAEMLRRVILFAPLVILIGGLVSGFSVIRSGTMGLVSALVVSWLFADTRMGPRDVLDALHQGAKGTIQLIAVCACAGLIVGVIGLTGIGQRFSSMILGIAGASELLALFFAMVISIILGMGMPTTAAYAVAASVVAPGLIKLGISPLIAHFFVFYYAVVSAITPPVALAAYAGAAIAGADPMRTSVSSFVYGAAAFLVPFMFFYSPAMLAQGTWTEILHVGVTACAGVYLLAAALQAWFFGPIGWALRIALFCCSLLLISGGWITDLAGLVPAVALAAWRILRKPVAAAGTAAG
jgi:TRAP transporter 4TM/12TM fusion protein